MRFHASPIRCTQALVIRGYSRGSYAAQSPYQALMLVLTRRGRHEVQGLLANQRLTGLDLARLRKACARQGIRLVTTRRHGRPATFTS